MIHVVMCYKKVEMFFFDPVVLQVVCFMRSCRTCCTTTGISTDMRSQSRILLQRNKRQIQQRETNLEQQNTLICQKMQHITVVDLPLCN